jgi:hypothetical protein
MEKKRRENDKPLIVSVKQPGVDANGLAPEG